MVTEIDEVIANRALLAAESSVASKASYGSAVGTAIFGIQLDEWGIIVGIVIGVSTFLLNAYYQRKKHKLDVLIAQSQLEKVATAVVDESQRELINRIKSDLVKEFGDLNRRKGVDRRVNDGCGYNGVERRKGARRKDITGDTEAAKALNIVTAVTQSAIKELDDRRKGTDGG